MSLNTFFFFYPAFVQPQCQVHITLLLAGNPVLAGDVYSFMRVSLKFFQSLLWTRSQGYSWACLIPDGGRATLALGLGGGKGPSCLLCVDSVSLAELSLGTLCMPGWGLSPFLKQSWGRGVAAPMSDGEGRAGTFPRGRIGLGSLGPRQSFWLKERLAGLPTKCVLALATAQRARLPLPCQPLPGSFWGKPCAHGGRWGRESRSAGLWCRWLGPGWTWEASQRSAWVFTVQANRFWSLPRAASGMMSLAVSPPSLAPTQAPALCFCVTLRGLEPALTRSSPSSHRAKLWLLLTLPAASCSRLWLPRSRWRSPCAPGTGCWNRVAVAT